jgi:hypothetical protein
LTIRSSWSERKIQEIKSLIKTELDAIAMKDGKKARLEYSQRMVMQLAASGESKDQLAQLIYIMSTLVHHERYGGLTVSQVHNAAELATSILKVNNIEEGRGRLSFLYGELRFVLSQIFRHEGLHWDAIWQHHMVRFSSRNFVQDEPANLLAAGNRALRLGHGLRALINLQKSLHGSLSPSRRELLILSIIKCARLRGDSASISDFLKLGDKEIQGINARRELAWENLWQEFLKSRDVQVFVRETQYRAPLHFPTFILEASLLTKCVSQKEAMSRISKIVSLTRRKNFSVRKQGHFFKIAESLEDCYDLAIPLPQRCRQLGKMLSMRALLASIDKELIALAASARFLSRSQCYDLASVCLMEYQNLSRNLTDGANLDSLGLVSDLVARAWYLERTAESSAISLVAG